jgi:CheY-like chemotaxis protein
MLASASVLIVDDDPVHLRIYGWIVEAAGYRALTAPVRSTGVQLPEEAADLVLLDYNLAGQSTIGSSAHCRQIRISISPTSSNSIWSLQ